jgi:signal transduction histidine kinase
MLGYSREELLRLNVHDLVPTEELSLTPIRFDELRAGKTLISERQVRRKDGTLLSAEISGKMLKEGVLQAFIRDITARKQAEAALHRAHDELERRVEERTTELAKTNEALQAEITERKQADEARMELLRKIVNTQEDERRRLALELHDQMGQDITAMILGLKSLENSYGEGKLDLHHLGQLQELTDQLERKVHNLAWELRPSALDDLGLSTALFNYMEEWSGRYRIEMDFQSIGLEDERLPPHVATTIYRIVQEALTNIAKHAEADSVSLVLVKRHENVSAIIEDNGKGFDMQAVMAAPIKERRLGLLGMRERVELVRGTLSIESAPGGGTTLFVRIPLVDAQNGADQRE